MTVDMGAEMACDVPPSGSEVFDAETFLDWLADRFAIPRSRVVLRAHLADDLGFDSIERYELLLALDPPAELAEPMVEEIDTVGDAFALWSIAGGRAPA